MHRFSDLSLKHYDEGIYCFGGLAILDGDPFRQSGGGFHLNPKASPPLYPLLVAASFLFIGVGPPMAILVSILAGTAAVPVAYILASRFGGRLAGCIAAAVVALNPILLYYSRMAMTDSLYVFLFILSLWLMIRAMDLGRWRDWIVCGAAVGLCMNAKIHGALPWIFYFVVAVIGVLSSPRTWRKWVLRPLGGAVVSAIFMIPMIVFISQTIGFAEMFSHYRGYVHSVPPWSIYSWTFYSGGAWLIVVGGVIQSLRWIQTGDWPAKLIATGSLLFLLLLSIYVPYPRLTAPFVALASVGAASLAGVMASSARRPQLTAIIAGALLVLPGSPWFFDSMTVNVGYREAVEAAASLRADDDSPIPVYLEFIRETPAVQFLMDPEKIRRATFSEIVQFIRQGERAAILADRSIKDKDWTRFAELIGNVPGQFRIERFVNPFPFLYPMTDEERRSHAAEPTGIEPHPNFVNVYLFAGPKEDEDSSNPVASAKRT
jgi:hypothetical protein